MVKRFLFLFLMMSYWIAEAQIPVCTAEGYRLMDDDGDFLDHGPVTYIDKSSPRYFLTYHGGSFYYQNNRGKKMFSKAFSIAYPFDGSFALVKRNGVYYHINPAGNYLDTLNWPKAPEVYQSDVLISRRQKSIWHASGKLLLLYSDTVIAGDRSGLFIWDKTRQTAQQFILPPGRDQLVKGKRFKNVVLVDPTQQGFVVVVQQRDSSRWFSIIDDRGRFLLQDEPDIGYYKPLRVIQQRWVFLSTHGTPAKIQTPWELNLWWPLKNLKSVYGNSPSSPIYISNRKALAPFGLIAGTQKWTVHAHGTVHGNYLFDQVLPSDSRTKNYPVRMDRQWYVYNTRNEQLDTLPFREIHPMGVQNEILLVSDTIGLHRQKKWALYSLKTHQKTEPLFVAPPKGNHRVKLYIDGIFNPWFNKVLQVQQDQRRVYYSTAMEQLFIEPQHAPTYALSNFYNYRLRITPRNAKAIPTSFKFSKKQLDLQLESKQGLWVQIANNSKQDLPITYQDGAFQLTLQYERTPGQWETIAAPPYTDCGNSFVSGQFPAQKMVEHRLAIPTGSAYVNVRMTLVVQGQEVVYSNVIRYALPTGYLQGYFPPFGANSKMEVKYYRNKRRF